MRQHGNAEKLNSVLCFLSQLQLQFNYELLFFSSLGSEQQVKCQLFISLRLSFLLVPEIIWPLLLDYFQ